jgi:hypothetical protein
MVMLMTLRIGEDCPFTAHVSSRGAVSMAFAMSYRLRAEERERDRMLLLEV